MDRARETDVNYDDWIVDPSYKDLVDQVVRAHKFGFPVAIHAVEEEAVRTAVNAILNSRSTVIKTLEGESNPDGDNLIFRPIPRDRIEHCSECPPSLLESIKKSGVVISTQPGFLYWIGAVCYTHLTLPPILVV